MLWHSSRICVPTSHIAPSGVQDHSWAFQVPLMAVCPTSTALQSSTRSAFAGHPGTLKRCSDVN